MKITKQRLREMIKEELEVILTDDEAVELFGNYMLENRLAPEYLREVERLRQKYGAERVDRVIAANGGLGKISTRAIEQMVGRVRGQ